MNYYAHYGFFNHYSKKQSKLYYNTQISTEHL